MKEDQFKAEVEKTIALYEKVNNRPATRTRNMINQRREVVALSLLVKSADLQQGFKLLRDSDQLDKTFEALVIKYKDLFEPDVVEAAEWRLKNPYNLLA